MELKVGVEVNKSTQSSPAGEFVGGSVLFASTVTLATEGEEFAPAPGVLLELFPTINLSRLGQNIMCNFRLDQLAGHDHHAPAFVTESDLQFYLDRVMKDLGEATSKAEAVTEDFYKTVPADLIASTVEHEKNIESLDAEIKSELLELLGGIVDGEDIDGEPEGGFLLEDLP